MIDVRVFIAKPWAVYKKYTGYIIVERPFKNAQSSLLSTRSRITLGAQTPGPDLAKLRHFRLRSVAPGQALNREP